MIEVFPQEISDGLEDRVSKSSSIAYLSIPISQNITDHPTKEFVDKIVKTTGSSKVGLFGIDTILASTGWNINTDIFTREEMWGARNTPEDKPLNYEHINQEIIGHITSNKVVDDKYNKIPDDAEFSTLPDRFHVLTSAVIYLDWENKSYNDKIRRVVAEIQDGNKWFVSMECLFKGFDYGIIGPDGEHYVKARNQDTAHLTKYLRQYGGNGVYDNYRIGRVLRNIVFSGKGLVTNPANPDSIIFNNIESFIPDISKSVYFKNVASNNLNSEKNTMDEIVKAELDKQTKRAEALEADNRSLRDQLSQVDVKAVKAQADSLTADLTTAKSKIEDISKKLTASENLVAEMTEKLEAAEKKSGDMEAHMKNMEKDKKSSARVSELVDAGVEVDEAKGLVDKWADVSDEAFAGVVAIAKKSAKSGTDTGKDNDVGGFNNKKSNPKAPSKGPGGGQINTEQYKGSASADEEELDSAVETDTPESATAGEEDETESLRASICDYLDTSREFKNRAIAKKSSK